MKIGDLIISTFLPIQYIGYAIEYVNPKHIPEATLCIIKDINGDKIKIKPLLKGYYGKSKWIELKHKNTLVLNEELQTCLQKFNKKRFLINSPLMRKITKSIHEPEIYLQNLLS